MAGECQGPDLNPDSRARGTRVLPSLCASPHRPVPQAVAGPDTPASANAFWTHDGKLASRSIVSNQRYRPVPILENMRSLGDERRS